ncbi:MAG: EpsG family protein [Bacteroidota bacterium]
MNSKIPICIFSAFLFLISPYLTLLILSFILIKNYQRRYFVNLFVILSVIFIAILNSTVYPESDLVNYYSWYNLAADFSISQYIFLFPSEPLFTSMTYVLYYITLGHKELYLVILTVLIYLPVSYSIVKFYEVNGEIKYVIIALVIFLYLPQVFSLSNNIIRQMMAGSFLIYYLVNKEIFGRNYIYLYIISVFIHSSALLFLPIIIVNHLNKIISYGKISFYITGLGILSMIYRPIILFFYDFINIPVIKLVLDRIIREPHTIYDPPPIYVLVFGGIVALIGIYSSLIKKDNKFKKLLFYYLFLLVFTVLNYNQTQISSRIIFYIYYFLPLIFPYSITRLYKIKRSSVTFLAAGIILLTNAYFIYAYQASIYTYEPGIRAFTDLLIYLGIN